MKRKLLKAAIDQKIVNANIKALGVIDFEGLEQSVDNLFSSFPNNFRHAFAVKATSLTEVVKLLYQKGMLMEVSSPGELELSLHAGVMPKDIIFDSPTKTFSDLVACIKSDISINIDNEQELYRIDQIKDNYPHSDSVIGFRVNPQIGSGQIGLTSTATKTSKFGYPILDNEQYEALIKLYLNRPWLNSVHTHTGSQGCSLDLLTLGIEKIVDLAEEINRRAGYRQVIHIDIGGGLPVNFQSDIISPTFTEYAKLLEKRVPVLFSGDYKVKTEFGRSITAKNGVIISRVEYTKMMGGRRIIATHAGAHIATRTALLSDQWPLRVEAFSPEGEPRVLNIAPTDIAGPCCFAADLIVKNKLTPKIYQNDYIIIYDTGAYSFTNHYDYNIIPKISIYSARDKFGGYNFICIRAEQSLESLVKGFS